MSAKKLLISVISALAFGTSVAMAAGIPENVTGVKAVAKDATSITVSWKAAKDGEGGTVKNYRIWYGTVSVLEAGTGDYEKQLDTPDNSTTYTVTGLKPKTKYYFSVTAFSTDGKESDQYSIEASATTKEEIAPAGAGPVEDTTSPTVASVSAPDKNHVRVTFSESIQLPATTPEAYFGIVEQINPSKELKVISATMDPADAAKKTVILESSNQTADVNYIVTAGVAIKDLAGNPMVSGSTDSGLFIGSSQEPAKVEETKPAEETPPATTPPATTTPAATAPAATAEECDKDLSCWLKHMVDCTLSNVSQADTAATTEYKMELTGSDENNCTVKYTALKHTNALFAGSTMDCKVAKGTYADMNAYNTVVDTKNCTGALVDGYKAIAVEPAKDTTPPENITKLILAFKKELEKYTVMLNWTASVNTAKDLVDQILYMSMDKGKNYDSGKSLGPTVVKTEVGSLEAGKEYAFKITTKDASGNESTGVVKSIRLPQTGAGVGFLLFTSVMGAKRLLRRKKQEQI
jgi:hypothetical protein